eukprot:TRINITY_DN8917_c0_g1_i13.p3 TRINITY_DN8917_c0_g1~~TRINITY_DN8917_c0_g1_i13.p3  ORF type:complete len:239 (+),score=-1.84 TRINITY_DN8917_c0_g1_i13:1278-1994(+)
MKLSRDIYVLFNDIIPIIVFIFKNFVVLQRVISTYISVDKDFSIQENSVGYNVTKLEGSFFKSNQSVYFFGTLFVCNFEQEGLFGIAIGQKIKTNTFTPYQFLYYRYGCMKKQNQTLDRSSEQVVVLDEYLNVGCTKVQKHYRIDSRERQCFRFLVGSNPNPFSKRACEGCTIIQERLNQFVLIQDSSFLVYKYVMDRSVYLELWLNQVFAIIWRPFVIFLLRQCNFFVASNVILMTF